MTAAANTILSTGTLSQALCDRLSDHDLVIDVSPFIQIKALGAEHIELMINTYREFSGPVIITSQHAVQALKAVWSQAPAPDGWKFYAVGPQTAELIKTQLGQVTLTATSAKDLANDFIAKVDPRPILYFCGDQRREELPMLLSAHNFLVHEVVIYQTIPTPHIYPAPYQGILFFSPSAVQSFFSLNQLPPSTLIFSIGPTTTAEIKKHTSEQIFTSAQPNKSNMIELVISIFSSKLILNNYDSTLQ